MKLLFVLFLTALSVGCGYSKHTTPVQPGTMPTIAQLVPNNANNSTNGGGVAFTLDVDGTNFAAKAVINFNGAAVRAAQEVYARNLSDKPQLIEA